MGKESENKYRGKTKKQLVEELEALNRRIEELKNGGEVVGEGQSEEYFRSLIENAMDAIAIVSGDGILAYESPSFARLFGWTEDDHIGVDPFSFVHEEDMQRTAEVFANLMQTPGGVVFEELRFWHKDGSLRTIEVVGQNLLDNPVVNGIVANLRDITERKQTEEELARYRQHLEELVEERTEELRSANEEVVEYAKELETLFNIGVTVSQTLNLGELLESVLEKVLAVTGMEAGGIYLLDEKTENLVLKAHRGASARFIRKMERTGVSRVILSGKPVVVEDVTSDSRLTRLGAKAEGLQAFTAVPIIAKETIVGMIGVGSYKPCGFPERDIRLLDSIANQIGMAVDNAQLYERALKLAFTDGLTGLYNRRYLMEQIEREMARTGRSKRSLSLMMLDLDGLKTINDRYGHYEGDEFLKALGRIISVNTRSADVAARWGGDEFMVLVTETGSKGALRIGERIRRMVDRCRREIEGEEVGISASIGIASYPTNASEITELIQKVDEAMYNAKREGKNQICVSSS